MFCCVGTNWRQQNDLGLQKSQENSLVHVTEGCLDLIGSHCHPVSAESVLQFVETDFQGLAIQHPSVGLICFLYRTGKLRVECFVRKSGQRAGLHGLNDLEALLCKCDQRRQLEDGLGDSLCREICILYEVSSVCEGKSDRIRRILVNRIPQSYKVSCLLGHLLSIHQNVSICPYGLRPQFPREDCRVIVDKERQMIWNQIFARYSEIQRIPVLEFGPQFLQRVPTNARLGFLFFSEIFLQQNVRPYSIGELFSPDVERSGLGSTQVVNALQEVSDCVVCHINRRIGQRFDDPLWVPRKHCSQAILTSTCPLVQPSKGALKAMSCFRRIGLHTTEAFLSKLSPPRFAIVQIPLIHQSDHTFVSRP
mmetsp:Transcript_12894/g.39674  ORF Transcript_12894/g.39674 Transcript_12894/m.39674 type:complete len:365 (+) Transcript_12894:2617-3711(+)